MTDWINHNGGPQPVADDVWVFVVDPIEGGYQSPANEADWDHADSYFVLNQHLIDAKQAEIDALRDDLETWQSVFPHVMPDRLKSDQQLADEDVAAKIGAARLEGIRLGLEAAGRAVCGQEIKAATKTGEYHGPGRFAGLAEATDLIRALDPDTIAREAVLDQLTAEAQAQDMEYDKENDQ